MTDEEVDAKNRADAKALLKRAHAAMCAALAGELGLGTDEVSEAAWEELYDIIDTLD